MINVPNRLIRYVIIINYGVRDALSGLIDKLETIEAEREDERYDKEVKAKGSGRSRKRKSAASKR
jgi:hypothetical protein